jgi:glycosyltransferase involved in cell wall biosynthesis
LHDDTWFNPLSEDVSRRINMALTNNRKILEIGNWPPPVCGWSMGLVGLRKELEARGWDCQVMNLNENRRVRSSEYIDVQNGWDFFLKVFRHAARGYATHTRVNGEMTTGFVLAFVPLLLARICGRHAFLTYAGGHRQSYFPAPKGTLRYLAFWLLFRIPHRIYCNSEEVRNVILITGVDKERVQPIPHFSSHYVEFSPAKLASEVEEFISSHDGVFFAYVNFRKEYSLEFVAKAVRIFSRRFPKIGFLFVGPPVREMAAMKAFLREQNVEQSVCLLPSVPHDVFLTLLSRSLAYIRTPMTDGTCSSVLEALKLRIPVLATDNGTRPKGTSVWQDGDLSAMLALMENVVNNRPMFVANLPEIELEDNAKKLADSIEMIAA